MDVQEAYKRASDIGHAVREGGRITPRDTYKINIHFRPMQVLTPTTLSTRAKQTVHKDMQ